MSKLIGILLQLSVANVLCTHGIPLKQTHKHTHRNLKLLNYLPQLSMIYEVLYVQVNMHRDKLRIKQPTRCIK
jgi:hypothetical protein